MNYYDKILNEALEKSKIIKAEDLIGAEIVDKAVKPQFAKILSSPKIHTLRDLIDRPASSVGGLNASGVSNPLSSNTSTTTVLQEANGHTWPTLTLRLRSRSELNETPPFCINQTSQEYVSYAAEFLLGFNVSDLFDNDMLEKARELQLQAQNIRPEVAVHTVQLAIDEMTEASRDFRSVNESTNEKYERLKSFFGMNYWKIGLIVVGTGLAAKLIFVGAPAANVVVQTADVLTAPSNAVFIKDLVTSTMPSISSTTGNIISQIGNLIDTTALYAYGLVGLKILGKIITRGKI